MTTTELRERVIGRVLWPEFGPPLSDSEADAHERAADAIIALFQSYVGELIGGVSRVEVIDYRPDAAPFSRVFVSGIDPDMEVTLGYQDNGRTLKVFLKEKPLEERRVSE